jgi:hypothetical protein
MLLWPSDSSTSRSARPFACSPFVAMRWSAKRSLWFSRHEVAILRRGKARPQLRWSDRPLIAARARLLQPERRASLIVTPATLVRWHREFARMSPRWRTGNGANCTPEPPDMTAARRWPRHDRPSGPDRCARRAPHGQLARHRGPGARAVADPPSTAGSQSRLRRPGHLRSPI